MDAATLALRTTAAAGLDSLFVFQLDEEANFLAAFTAADMMDRAAYLKKYTPFLGDPTIHMRTILRGDRNVGSIAKFALRGRY